MSKSELKMSVAGIGSVSIEGDADFVSRCIDAVAAIVIEESVKKVMEAEGVSREVALQMHVDEWHKYAATHGIELAPA